MTSSLYAFTFSFDFAAVYAISLHQDVDAAILAAEELQGSKKLLRVLEVHCLLLLFSLWLT